MAEDIEDRFKFLPSARDCGTENEEVQHLVLTDTINFHLWHVNGSGSQCYRKRSHNCLARVYFDEELRRYVQGVNHNDHPNDEQEILNRERKHYCKVQFQQTNISYEAIHARVCELCPFKSIQIISTFYFRKQKDGTNFYSGEVLWMDVATGNEESAQVFGNFEVLRAASDPLTRKSKQLHVLAIDLVKQKCQELFGRIPAPTIFVADYELALLGAVTECFAGCKSRGCWFHTSQAIYCKACNFGLEAAYTTLQVVRRIIRMGMNLPLLNNSLIPQGLESRADKLRTLGCKANRDISNAESGMLISEQRKLDKQIRENTDQLDRELTGNPDADIQPITEFLKTATEDNTENYPKNDFTDAYENHAPHIHAAFQMLLDPTQVLVPQARPLNRNEPPLQFADPIRIAPQPARRVGRLRLNPLPQPRAINYQAAVSEIARRNAAVYRGRQRGGRRAVPVLRPAVEPEPEILATEMEVENFFNVQQNQECLAGDGERQQLV
ncbi:hypothetical protein OUZ56_016958 [Daphnia magna]|uniref:MULE transposase domain-containing protein n=1 Tax=Daphnia magna TaxID=35525 RepID=A0ABR0ARR8_9CRUS|nr:hypothetical protein OUZ56_016958 [Daphnia magna]